MDTSREENSLIPLFLLTRQKTETHTVTLLAPRLELLLVHTDLVDKFASLNVG